MKRYFIPAITIVALITALGPNSFAAMSAKSCDAVGGNYIVSFNNGVSQETELQNVNGDKVTPSFHYSKVLNGFSGFLTAGQVCNLQGRSSVEFVEADQVVKADALQIESPATWGISRIDSPGIVDTTYTYSATGKGVTVYVLDTGINTTNNEFTGRINPGYAGINDGRGIEDCQGHGTHVSGTIAGTVFGVAKQATITPVRVLDCAGNGTVSGVIAGLDWIKYNHKSGKAVANMSLSSGTSRALDKAVSEVIADGVSVVVAAGNSADDACNYSPAQTPKAITVAASDIANNFAYYSNYGKCVDIIAPGSAITSAWIGGVDATHILSGTSMATPHVTGTVALLLESGAMLPGATSIPTTNQALGVITIPSNESKSTINSFIFTNPNSLDSN